MPELSFSIATNFIGIRPENNRNKPLATKSYISIPKHYKQYNLI